MQSTIDIESVRIFRAVVDAGSFSAAGDVLDKDKAHVSRVVSWLENRLSVQLLQRSTRRLQITEVVTDLYERACSALEETEASIARAKSEPTMPDELHAHHLIMFISGGALSWRLVKDGQCIAIDKQPLLTINNTVAASDMAVEGLGIALLPRFQAAPLVERRRLKRVLNEWEQTPVPVSAVFPSTRYMAPEVRSFVDLAINAMANR